ncbi:MAG: diaminopimelate decarboxylase [Pseudomonadota bacterium]
MTAFEFRDGVLHAEDVPLTTIAEQFGTPTFVYSQGYFEQRYAALRAALDGIDHELCYAVKANSNLSVLHTFAQLGAGFDIVSGGELQRVLTVGGDPARVLFSGVGKTVAEIDLALKHQIGCFNVESAEELERLAARAALLHTIAPVSIRVNPNVDAATHPYISTGLKTNKFGVPAEQAPALYRFAAAHPALRVVGIDCHIGSQIADPAPLLEAMNNLLALVDNLAAEGIVIEHLDLGGGLGVTYDDEPDFAAGAYGAALRTALKDRHLKLLLEPGRFLVANGGVLLTRIEYLKPAADAASDGDAKNFAIVDAAMNDLIRPALYQAHHGIETVQPAAVDARRWDIVGPVCESGDFLAKDRLLALESASLLAVHSAGAYGMVQSSNYNTRGRAAEVMVNGATVRRIRHRETVRDQIALELDGLPASVFDVDLRQTGS